jgi:hypothetical protein
VCVCVACSDNNLSYCCGTVKGKNTMYCWGSNAPGVLSTLVVPVCAPGFKVNSSLSCLACPPPTLGSFSEWRACDDGTYVSNGYCAACPGGESRIGDNNETCAACPANTYAQGSPCLPCGFGYTSNAGAAECTSCFCWTSTNVVVGSVLGSVALYW